MRARLKRRWIADNVHQITHINSGFWIDGINGYGDRRLLLRVKRTVTGTYKTRIVDTECLNRKRKSVREKRDFLNVVQRCIELPRLEKRTTYSLVFSGETATEIFYKTLFANIFRSG